MRKLVLGSLVAVLVASAAWLWSERGSRAGELLVPHAKTAQRERTSPLVEPPPETVERREVESTSPVAEPVQSSSTVQVVPEPVFHGRVVDALRQNPIAGARLHLGEGPLRFVGGTRTLDPPVRIVGESDAAGQITVRGIDAARPRHALLLADAYAPAIVLIDPGHETLERAAWLELLPAPSLEVRAIDAAGLPQSGVAVELIVTGKLVMVDNLVLSGGNKFTVRTLTDSDGRTFFENLPAEMPIELRFLRGEKPIAAAETFALLSGERSSLARMVGTGTVRGRIVDEAGGGIADLPLALAASNWELRFAQSTVSGLDGSFEFLEVPFGRWFVRPSLDESRYSLEGGATEWSSKGEFCLVDRPEVEVHIQLPRGLSLEGSVFGGVYESVIARPVEPGAEPLAVMTDSRGAFRFESVAPAMYEVYAIGLDGRSTSVLAEAGTSGIELEFPPLEAIRLVLRGVAPEARVTLALINSEAGSNTMSGAMRDLEFTVVPGTSAHVTSGEKIGIVNGALRSPAPSTSEIVLDLEPGATLTTVNAGSGLLFLRVWSDDCLLLHEDLLRGESEQCLVPAGAVRAELLDGERVVASETVTLAPRERRRLVLAPE